MRSTRMWLAAAFAALAFGAAAAPGDPVKVVYHVNEGNDQATAALRNPQPPLGRPEGEDRGGHPRGRHQLPAARREGQERQSVRGRVQDLVSKGVEFRVCNFTLQSRNIDPKQVIEEAKIVPSGVAEVSRLQSQEGTRTSSRNRNQPRRPIHEGTLKPTHGPPLHPAGAAAGVPSRNSAPPSRRSSATAPRSATATPPSCGRPAAKRSGRKSAARRTPRSSAATSASVPAS